MNMNILMQNARNKEIDIFNAKGGKKTSQRKKHPPGQATSFNHT